MTSNKNKVKVLLLGKDGLLGSAIYERLNRNPSVHLISTSRRSSQGIHFEYGMDSLSALLHAENPDFVINCLVERHPHGKLITGIGVNTLLPINLARQSGNYGFQLITFSTNAVFWGGKEHYFEDSISIPKSIYGWTKLISDLGSHNALIIRTSLIGVEGKNLNQPGLVERLSRLQKDSKIEVSKDHMWNGLTSSALARIIEGVISRNLRINTTIHLIPSNVITMHELILRIASKIDRADLKVQEVAVKKSTNLILSSKKIDLLKDLWLMAGYKSSPDITQLISEM